MAVVTSRIYELSPQQQTFLREGPMGHALPRCRGRVRIDGPLDTVVLESALDRVVATHEVLRTEFVPMAGLRVPVQRVCANPRLRLVRREAGNPDRVCDVVAAAWRELSVASGKDDTSAIPNFALIRAASDLHHLLIDLSPMMADAATLSLLCEAVAAAYSELQDGRMPVPPAVQYSDVSTWLGELRQTDHWAMGQRFWSRVWSRHRPEEIAAQRLALETAGSTPFRPRSIPLQTGAHSSGISRLAAARGVPPAAVMLSAWAAIVGKFGGIDRQVIGYACSLRSVDGMEAVLGPCRTVVPVSIALQSHSTFGQLIGEVATMIEAGQAWQQVFEWPSAETKLSGEEIGAASDFLPFAFECRPRPAEVIGAGLRLWLEEIDDGSTRYALRLYVETDGDEHTARLDYDATRYEAAAARHIATEIELLLAAATASPDAKLARLIACDEAAARSGGTIRPATTALPTQPYETIHEGFRRQAARYPDRIAVEHGDIRLKFAELDLRSARIARHLARIGVGCDVPVALCLPRSVDAVAAMLGVLKAGGCFVPLSPADPPDRIGDVLRSVSARAVITTQTARSRLPDFDGHIVCLDQEAGFVSGDCEGDPDDLARARQAAYIIHTSGSSGRPKGVVIEHRSALVLLRALEATLAGILPDRPLRVSVNAPFTFDASIQQLVFLLRGDCAIIIPEDIRLTPPALNAFLAQKSIDVFDCTPSHLRRLVDAGLTEPTGPRPAAVLVAGEAVDPGLWSRLAGVSGTAFFNIYGPTEATVDATAARIERAGQIPTIGRPMPGYGIYVLNSNLEPVSVGVPGEIHIGGTAVARGYHGQPGLTAGCFLPDPYGSEPGGRMYATGDRALVLTSGELQFLGRNDAAFKLRGVRIDPTEIEAALCRSPGIRQAAVVLTDGPRGEPVVTAHLCLEAGQALDRTALRDFLRKSLPDVMLPASYVFHDQLPLLSSGKIDRAVLQAIAAPELTVSKELPRTPLEAVIAEVWQSVLENPSVGRDENFFELGGHSLMLFKVQHLLTEKIGRPVPLTDLVTFDTVSKLAAHLDEPGCSEDTIGARDTAAGSRHQGRLMTHDVTNGDV